MLQYFEVHIKELHFFFLNLKYIKILELLFGSRGRRLRLCFGFT